MKQVLFLSHTPWRAPASRAQQLAARLRGGEVLFFEPVRGGRAGAEGRQVRPNVTVYPLPAVRFLPGRAQFLWRQAARRQAALIQRAAERHGFREPLVWATRPDQVHLLDHLSFRGLVYDCDTDWSQLPPQWEGDLAAAADVVFAASPGLVDRLSPCSANIALLPNGVNFPMFSRPSGEVPPELQDIRGPVLGWVGTIDAGLDLSPVEHAARARPDWTFVLLGRIREGARLGGLEGLGNVRLLGWRPAVEVPASGGRYDGCLVPRREDRPYRDRIPGRIVE